MRQTLKGGEAGCHVDVMRKRVLGKWEAKLGL